MSVKPVISFLVCTRDRASVARECVLHLLDSPRRDIEVVVRDNCSSDDTLAMLRGINDPRLRVHAAPENQGTITFFEIAKLATGGVVTWLSDEDDFQFEHLDFVLDTFNRDATCNVLFGSILVGAARPVTYADARITDPVRICLTALSFSGCGGLFVRRTALPAAHTFNVRDQDDAYALWNFYPVGFFASRCVAETLITTSRVVAVQSRHAQTTNNWSGLEARLPHYYPETVFDRLASSLANVYFKPMPGRLRVFLALRLIRLFRMQTTWYADPKVHALLREHYPAETVERFLEHIRALRLGHPLGRLIWAWGRILALPVKFSHTLGRWRQLGASLARTGG